MLNTGLFHCALLLICLWRAEWLVMSSNLLCPLWCISEVWSLLVITGPGLQSRLRGHVLAVPWVCFVFCLSSLPLLFSLSSTVQQNSRETLNSLCPALKEIFFQLCYKDFFLVPNIAWIPCALGLAYWTQYPITVLVMLTSSSVQFSIERMKK